MAPSPHNFIQATTTEWLDEGYGSAAEVAKSLDDLWRINRFLGGWRSLMQHLAPRLRAAPSPITLADLGAGAADIPIALARWARDRHLRLRILAVDRAGRHLRLAQSRARHTPEVIPLCAEAGQLPLPPRSVDFVISSLFLHHFTPPEMVHVLASARAVARRGLIMTDLIRSPWPRLAFKVFQPVLARSPITRHDGEISLRRAYTPRELRTIARAAGLPNVRIHTHWPWRMTLVSDEALHVEP